MIQLSEFLAPQPESWWPLIKQAGVSHVVGSLNGGENDQRFFAAVGQHRPLGDDAAEDVPWSEAAVRNCQEVYGRHGFELAGIEDNPPMDKVRLGLAGRDEQIDNILTQVRAMGQLGIPVLCYDWMALSAWARSNAEIVGRGGALVTGFKASDLDSVEPLVEEGEVTEQQLWEALTYFLEAVVPVAEEHGVRLAMHPDDPPRALFRNLPRIMRSPTAYRRLLELYPSPSNGITFCQGNFALMDEGANLPKLIREFGDKILFVHFRDVRGTVDDFQETFQDEGQTDMPECMRAYAEVGFSGPMRPDHVPTMAGELNDRPGYAALGRLFALGYIRALEQASY